VPPPPTIRSSSTACGNSFSSIPPMATGGSPRGYPAVLRYGDQRVINRKKVHRIVKAHGWQVTQRQATPRPRVVKRQSVASRSNERWALDATHIDCGADGWGHLVAVIDCFDREIVGYEFALRGRANEAERALEMACLTRFGTATAG